MSNIPSAIPPKREQESVAPSPEKMGGRTVSQSGEETKARASSQTRGKAIAGQAATPITERLTTASGSPASTIEGREPSTAQEYFELGKQHFENGEIDAAKNCFSQASKLQPVDAQVIAEIAIIYQNVESSYADLGDIDICQIALKGFTAIDKEIDVEGFDVEGVTINKQAILDKINELPAGQQVNAMARFNAVQEMVKEARMMLEDKWNEAYTNAYIKARLALRREGIIEKIADKLELEGLPVEGRLVDPTTGKLCDGLRGEDSVVEKLAEHMKRAGGDYALVQAYLDDQKTDSWNFVPHVFKVHMVQNRTISEENYYWKGGFKKAQKRYNNYTMTTDKEVLAKTFCIAHAFTTEMLNKMDLPGKDNEAKTIRVYRTESLRVLRRADIEKTDNEEFKNMIYRGALESGSIIEEVNIYGAEVTKQNVPIHRFFWTYLPRNPDPSADPNRTGLYSDDEKEFLFMPEYIPFAYT